MKTLVGSKPHAIPSHLPEIGEISFGPSPDAASTTARAAPWRVSSIRNPAARWASLRKFALAVWCCTVASTSYAAQPASGGAAADYPTKPIRLVVPFPPGASADFTARQFAQKLSDAWGQQVLVDNRPGAGGAIGPAIVAKSTPDGYTLLLGSAAGQVIGPAFGQKLPYDSLKDFAPIGLGVSVPFALALNAAVPANSTRELIDLAKAQPGRLNCASVGTGSTGHLACELFKVMAGVNVVHVPYKGGAPAVTDLISGQVHMIFSGIAQVLPHIKTGRLKAIAIANPTQRSQTLPELPLVTETLPGFSSGTWYGLFAPAGTPKAIITKINAELSRALASPEFAARLLMNGVEPYKTSGTPEALQEMIRGDIAHWRKVIKDAGITAE